MWICVISDKFQEKTGIKQKNKKTKIIKKKWHTFSKMAKYWRSYVSLLQITQKCFFAESKAVEIDWDGMGRVVYGLWVKCYSREKTGGGR